MAKLEPLNDNVILKRDEGEGKTPGGIILPDIAKNKPETGVVVAVGPGKRDEQGRCNPISLKPGQRVAFTRYSGHEITHDEQDYLVVAESNILAVINSGKEK